MEKNTNLYIRPHSVWLVGGGWEGSCIKAGTWTTCHPNPIPLVIPEPEIWTYIFHHFTLSRFYATRLFPIGINGRRRHRQCMAHAAIRFNGTSAWPLKSMARPSFSARPLTGVSHSWTRCGSCVGVPRS
ncbi:hypothetical protein FKM82_027620 [Ascaphus truei]